MLDSTIARPYSFFDSLVLLTVLRHSLHHTDKTLPFVTCTSNDRGGRKVVGALVIDHSLILVYSMDFGALMAAEMITRNDCSVVLALVVGADTEQRSGWCDETNPPAGTTQTRVGWSSHIGVASRHRSTVSTVDEHGLLGKIWRKHMPMQDTVHCCVDRGVW